MTHLRRSKKGKMTVEYMIAIVILIILLFVVGYYIVYERIGKAGKDSMPLCNNQLQKCACFYQGGVCPDVYMRETHNSRMCPENGATCTDETYSGLLQTANDKAARATKGSDSPKGADKFYGTCCMAPHSKVSPTRLREWSPSEAAEPVASTTPAASAEDAITTEIVTIDFRDSTPVRYRYNTERNYWEGRGNVPNSAAWTDWTNVAAIAEDTAYFVDQRGIARSLRTRDQESGYEYLRNLDKPNLEACTPTTYCTPFQERLS